MLITVTVLDLACELLYHVIEKDWPTMLGPLTGVDEGLLLWLPRSAACVTGVTELSGPASLIGLAAVRICTWLLIDGPIRVVFVRGASAAAGPTRAREGPR